MPSQTNSTTINFSFLKKNQKSINLIAQTIKIIILNLIILFPIVNLFIVPKVLNKKT